ncbi:hypothetical protein [Lacrimispora sp.]|uniref:hypothetical protein n=1 Tax=Lacrimispora sp. TaxID=2719234 RepID=UPI003460D6B9
MNLHKCDMCGLYLTDDGNVCQECDRNAETVKKVAEKGRIGVDYGTDGIESDNRGYEDMVEL